MVHVGGGEGFQVDPGALSEAATQSASFGAELATLSERVGPSLSVGTLGGLRIGAAIGRAASSWTHVIDALAQQVSGAASSLSDNAAAYARVEQAVLGSVSATGRAIQQ